MITRYNYSRNVTLTIKAREAGILILPDGGSREDLVVTTRVREYVLKHVHDWYRFMNPGRIHLQITCPNGSLAVVTGHDSAPSSALAVAYPYNVTGKIRSINYSDGEWKGKIGFSSDSWGTRPPTKNEVRCAVFVRTMRFALSTHEWVEHLLQNQPIEIAAFYYMPTTPVFGLRAEYQKLKERIFTKSPNEVSSECNEA